MESSLPLLPNLETIAYLRQASAMLDLPVRTTATALVYYHRFHAFIMDNKNNSHTGYARRVDESLPLIKSEELLANACLFLACKLTEVPRKVRDVVNVGYTYFHPNAPLLSIDQTYFEMRKSLATSELLLVRALDYELEIHLPFAFCLNTLRSMIPLPDNWKTTEDMHKLHPEEARRRQQRQQREAMQRDVQGPWNALARMAWMFLWDSLCSPRITIKHAPPALALGCLYLAMRTSNVEMPLTIFEWVNRCGASSNVSVQETQDVITDLLEFYAQSHMERGNV